ncbi:MAG: hypothetical protein U1E65_21085 [Myxococcota bacterium]
MKLWVALLAFLAWAPRAGALELEVTAVELPGSPDFVGMDYLAVEAGAARVWVPAGNTGKVDLVGTQDLKVHPLDGFPVNTSGQRSVGPSSVTIGEGFVYVGNRANRQVCAVDAQALNRGACVSLDSMPDGLAYIPSQKEVWVTTPRDKSLTILSVEHAGAPEAKTVLHLDGEPEGYAVDAAKGVFYTNLEDKDATLVFDAASKKEVARYSPGCGEAGPRGLALDSGRGLLIVACTDKLVALQLHKGGAKGGELKTGAGVDNIDYVPGLHQVYAASGKSATLTVAELSPSGALKALATAKTAEGARVVVADSAGTAFVADSGSGRVLVVKAKAKAKGKK